MILKVFLKRKISGYISVEYLGSISRKNLKGITREISGRYFWKNLRGITGEIIGRYFWKNLRGVTGEIFVGYFEEDFGENIDHYNLFVDIKLQTNILKRNLKFILNSERV
jgi:hypothetical protein